MDMGDPSEAVFTDEWVEQNPWMGEVNPPNSMCMFINFPNGIPVPKLRKEWDRIEQYEKEQAENLAIFQEMLKEKAIRPGFGSVGKKHRGWGNGKQRN